MAFQKGNEYYLLRQTIGAPIKYTEEEFLTKANEYFNFCLNNPLKEQVIQKIKVSRDQEEIVKVSVDKMRAFTIIGLCNYLGISFQTFLNYNKKDHVLFEVSMRARHIIEMHQTEGAASNLLNANITAKLLGLAEKRSIELTDKKLPEWMEDE